MLVRFEKGSNLENFGFDLRSDRVIRFDKKLTGTYLNTRATYSINERQYTHLFLRTKAIDIKTSNESSDKKLQIMKPKILKWVGILMLCVIFGLVTECSTSFNFAVNVIEN